MSRWNAKQYLEFGDERTRPAVDLAARIRMAKPKRIVDLGCGPGNSTEVLRRRWPDAEVIGIDNSEEMIAAARSSYPEQGWVLASAEKWTASTPFDVVFSNAALQWLGDHGRLVSHLLKQVAPGGVLAFQIPSAEYAPVRRHMHEVAEEPAWCSRMHAAKTALTMKAPAFYYDVLADSARALDIWETEYHHVLESPKAIVEWMSSTGLRPFLAALDSGEERARFVALLEDKVAKSYPLRRDGKVLFPFRRLFVVAYR
jgi:trans-aconitate 2-methyltransferase